MVLAREKVGVGSEDPILIEHVDRLTGKLIDAVAFCQFDKKLKGVT